MVKLFYSTLICIDQAFYEIVHAIAGKGEQALSQMHLYIFSFSCFLYRLNVVAAMDQMILN